MKVLHKLVAAGLLASVVTAAPAMAQTAAQGPNSSATAERPQAGQQPQDQILVAQELYQLGVAERDPVLVIAAARIMARVGSSEVTRESTTDAPATATAPTTRVPDLAMAIDTARQLAQGNTQLLAMVDGLGTQAQRGRVAGPGFVNNWVAPGFQRDFTINFQGREYAQVWLAGDGNSLLNLQVFDENGNHLCTARRAGDRQSCGWTPVWTGSFRVRIVNVGGTPSNFRMSTN